MRISDNVLHHEMNGEMVLLDVPTGNYYTLNEISTMIWRGLSSGIDCETILEQVIEQYDADSDRIKQDFDEVVVMMKEEGLITNG